MALKKNPKAELRGKYQKYFEVSLIVSLAVLIVAFKFFPHLKEAEKIATDTQELFNVEDVQQTKQENRPPPPPKPPIPIEAPSDDVLEDIEISSTELNVNEEVKAPPPPPEKKVEEEPTYFVAVEDMPEPIGGIAAIQSKIVYPEIAKRAGVEGRVFITAFVNEQGVVTKAVVLKGIGAGCDEAALEAVKATKFKPGRQRGQPVKVQVSVPVVFRLNN
ncbi:MAG TPA: energy transducer TonB [Ignavibacteriaceae bacterium]|nr:energy transducer TonB [Ignavibacteriaceae bacterium]